MNYIINLFTIHAKLGCNLVRDIQYLTIHETLQRQSRKEKYEGIVPPTRDWDSWYFTNRRKQREERKIKIFHVKILSTQLV